MASAEFIARGALAQKWFRGMKDMEFRAHIVCRSSLCCPTMCHIGVAVLMLFVSSLAPAVSCPIHSLISPPTEKEEEVRKNLPRPRYCLSAGLGCVASRGEASAGCEDITHFYKVATPQNREIRA